MSLDIQLKHEDDIAAFELDGRLDTNTAPDLENQVTGRLSEGCSSFLIDLAGVDYISSAGLRVFLMLAKKLGRSKGKMVLCGMNDHVREVFDIAGFSKIFIIESDVSSARCRFD